jgi:hypothetical protein
LIPVEALKGGCDQTADRDEGQLDALGPTLC